MISKSLETTLEVNFLLRKVQVDSIVQSIMRTWEKMRSNENFYMKVEVL